MGESNGAMAPTSTPDMPARVHREPSQQELEIAQHLIEHSQSSQPSLSGPSTLHISSQQPEFPRYQPQDLPAYATNGDEHHDLTNSLQYYTRQGLTAPAVQQSSGAERALSPASVSSNVVSSGQRCR